MEQSVADIKARLFLFEAARWIGIKEVGSDNHGQIVEMFQKAVDGRSAGEPWCMAFVQFCIQMTDRIYDEITLSSNAPSKLMKTEHCATLWNSSTIADRLDSPQPGCLVIWQFWKDGKATSQGHVGIVKQILPNNKIQTIEGNTSDGLGIVREGNGVYLREREMKDLPSMKILGYLKIW